ncbi:uncharacterized protein EAE98_002111 [Botrytis deweyae]|uniref:Uncharacterized protein n=1 Tax=Botrytis deweyae TaxID=2478750 RepID=A0ABQ7IWD5_9HELO|nr:uncharacterized protein EAE98_002111 [Botrytis deweyae]KAF7935891.1 hypothetical protein EAE98_002111 [Botrytis deweyae]
MAKRVRRKRGSAVAKTTAKRKEETLTPVIMDGPPAVQYQSKIPFDFNYYGDFYFTSRTDHTMMFVARREAKIGRASDSVGRRDHKIVSYQRYNILDLEVYIAYLICRPGPFRFMDLPIEVRTIIFQLIASVILYFDPKSKTYINSIAIGGSNWKFEYKKTYGMGFAKWLENMCDFRRSFLPKKERKQHSKFIKEANEFVYIHHNHPNRNGYYMENFNINHATMPDSDFLDWADLKWIRMLANVSTQFRLELGSVIWERSRIYCNGDKDDLALDQLLTACPGIAKGLKELVIEVAYLQFSNWEKSSDESMRSVNEIFSDFVHLISQKLNLEYLTIWLVGTKSALVKLTEGEGPMKILTNIRDLKVTKGFRIQMSACFEISDNGSRSSPDPEFNIKWEPKVTAALLPDVLRPQTPKTDRNRYLESRAKEQEIGAID